MKKGYLWCGLVALVASGVAGAGLAGAVSLSQQNEIEVRFTFEPMLAVSVSSADIIIRNLAPGTTGYSNTVTVGVDTNSIAGYTLSAKVGDGTNFTDSNLALSGTSAYFASLAATDNSVLSDFAPSQWGYTVSGNISDSTQYSGLLYDADRTINATTDASGTAASGFGGTNSTNFTIGAKASTGQLAGDYRNVIVFTAVSNVPPVALYDAFGLANKQRYNGFYKMQDMSAEICDSAEAVDEQSQMRAVDVRDGKLYWITKLRDGKCWMTQNLDHDIDATRTYMPADTDIPANWVPDKSTRFAPIDGITFGNAYILESYDPGDDKIWDGTLDGSYSLDNLTQGTNLHYHIGNYYNWSAAVAMNDTSAYTTQNQDVDQSICPKGWTLPKSGNITTAGSFQYLLDQYGFESNGPGSGSLDINSWEAPLYFPLGGWLVDSEHVNAGTTGFFWSSVIDDWTDARNLITYRNGSVMPGGYGYRAGGFSVRCVSR